MDIILHPTDPAVPYEELIKPRVTLITLKLHGGVDDRGRLGVIEPLCYLNTVAKSGRLLSPLTTPSYPALVGEPVLLDDVVLEVCRVPERQGGKVRLEN